MIKKLFAILFLSALCLSFSTAANAEIAIDDEGNYVNVDKFVPSRGVKVKHSQLAEMMENGTRKAMNRNSSKQQAQQEEEEKYNRFAEKPSEFEKYKQQNKNRNYVTFGGYRLF